MIRQIQIAVHPVRQIEVARRHGQRCGHRERRRFVVVVHGCRCGRRG